MLRKSKSIRVIIVVICAICIILGVISNWRAYNYRKSCIGAKASIISIDIKPMSGKAIASIHYVISYLRDHSMDTIEFSTTREYDLNKTLPTIDNLKNETWYVHYIPIKYRNGQTHKDEVFIRNKDQLELIFKPGWFYFMLIVLVIGYLINPKVYHNK